MKTYFSQFPRLLSATFLFLLTSPLCLAQVPVVDAAGSVNQPVSSGQSGNNDLLLTLYNQIEQLQQEVQSLRGMVEEQSFQIRRMQTEQRDRYIDVDSRLNELSMGVQPGMPGVNPQAGAATGTIPGVDLTTAGNPPVSPNTPGLGNTAVNTGQANTGGVTTGVATGVTTGTAIGTTTGSFGTRPAGNNGLSGSTPQVLTGTAPDPVTAIPVPTAQNEEEIYTTALNLLLNESRIEESIAGFGRYIDAYPNGQFLANAFYWQGEALILANRFAQAESVFRKVLDDYPAHAKAADAMLKLGVVYQRTGNIERAREAWESISVRYPQSANTIRVAQDYLSRL